MQSKPKSNSIITSRVPDTARMVSVTVNIPSEMIFTVLGVGDVAFDLASVHADNLGRAVVHGWNQRIPDGAAIGVTDKDGVVIPKAERTRIKYERMNDLCRHYESGTAEWSRVSTGGQGARSITIEAIARVQSVDYDEASRRVTAHAERKYGGDRAKALATLRAEPKVQEAMLAIQRERMPEAAVDATSALDELAGL